MVRKSLDWCIVPYLDDFPERSKVSKAEIQKNIFSSECNGLRIASFGMLLTDLGLTKQTLPFAILLVTDPDEKLRGTVLATLLSAVRSDLFQLEGNESQILCKAVKLHATGLLLPWGLGLRYKLGEAGIDLVAQEILAGLCQSRLSLCERMLKRVSEAVLNKAEVHAWAF
jgi:hypothetical protein